MHILVGAIQGYNKVVAHMLVYQQCYDKVVAYMLVYQQCYDKVVVYMLVYQQCYDKVVVYMLIYQQGCDMLVVTMLLVHKVVTTCHNLVISVWESMLLKSACYCYLLLPQLTYQL